MTPMQRILVPAGLAFIGLSPSPSFAQAQVSIGFDADRAMVGKGAVEVTVTSSGDSLNDGMRLPFAEVSEGDRKVATLTDENGASENPIASVRIVELDSTNETPEVVFNSFSGGAHCCAGLKVALKGTSGSWRQVDIGSFDGSGDFVEDVDGDGRSEFVTVDNAFLNAFDSYAGSFSPLKILAVERGELKDVTREERFQSRHRSWLEEQTKAARDGAAESAAGFLVGRLAMRQLLREGPAAMGEFEAAAKAANVGPVDACPDLSFECEDGAKKPQPFIAVVKAFMEKNGYAF
jgi:hypothetical protein